MRDVLRLLWTNVRLRYACWADKDLPSGYLGADLIGRIGEL